MNAEDYKTIEFLINDASKSSKSVEEYRRNLQERFKALKNEKDMAEYRRKLQPSVTQYDAIGRPIDYFSNMPFYEKP